jgi:preprotein translocase subunit SecG
MFTLLNSLLIVLSIVLIGAILLQSGKGSGLAASFGGASSSSDSIMGAHQLATGLTKWTWYLGGMFLLLAYALAIMSARPAVPKSVLEQGPPITPTQQVPVGTPAGASPLVPLQPVPAAPAAPAPAPAPKPRR